MIDHDIKCWLDDNLVALFLNKFLELIHKINDRITIERVNGCIINFAQRKQIVQLNVLIMYCNIKWHCGVTGINNGRNTLLLSS